MEQKLYMNDDYILYFVAVYIDTKRGNEKPYIDEGQIGKRKKKSSDIQHITQSITIPTKTGGIIMCGVFFCFLIARFFLFQLKH